MASRLWRLVIAWLVWLSSDSSAVDKEAPRAAAAVAAARASMIVDAPPGPAPVECVCGETCERGIWKPDGRVEQRCECECNRCVGERAR